MKGNLFRRIVAAGFTGFYRNRTVSLSSILILTITLSIIAAFYFFHATFTYTLSIIRDKVDVRIYFTTDATESQISSIKARLLALPEVKSVTYTSKEETLDKFKETHSGDQLTLQALEELGENPFGSSLSILAKDPSHYEEIARQLQTGSRLLGEASTVVDKINYYQLKGSIERLTTIINWLNTVGVWLSLIFVIMSCMIVYNTVRLAIFVFRDEIAVMKLVGASNMYIRGPFIVEAVLYALVATAITLLMYWPATVWLTKKTIFFFEGLNFFAYYKANIFELSALLLCSGALLAIISSLLAVRKYLRV